MKLTLPTCSTKRKDVPLVAGCDNYFPAALVGVAMHSLKGNRKHNGEGPLHHSRGKSSDHAECIRRHLMDVQDFLAAIERGDVNRIHGIAQLIEEVNALAWRALALSQEAHERYAEAPLAPGARLPEPGVPGENL